MSTEIGNVFSNIKIAAIVFARMNIRKLTHMIYNLDVLEQGVTKSEHMQARKSTLSLRFGIAC